MTDFAFSLGPEPAGAAPVTTQFFDEPPVAESEASEGAFRHAVRRAEGVDFVEDGVVRHVASYMRVFTRAQEPCAGRVPKLRACTRYSYSLRMVNTPQVDLGKLKALIVANTGEGKRFKRRGLSMAATNGRNPDLVRDIMRAGKQNATLAAAAGICAALEVGLSEVVKGVQVATEAEEWLTVCKTVNAGVWRESTDWTPDEIYEVKVGLPMVDGERYGAVVEGRSMDRTLPPGTILECVKLIGSDIVLRDGDYVIAQRKQGDLYEMTCKRLHIMPNGSFELQAESYQPEFSKPIFMGKPDKSFVGEDETSIVAVVVRGHLKLFNAETRRAKAA